MVQRAMDAAAQLAADGLSVAVLSVPQLNPLPVADLVDGKAMVATHFDDAPLPAIHGGPARLLVPQLYFWKSAKWVRRLVFIGTNIPGFWESRGSHIYGDPWREQRYDGDR